MNPWQLAQQIKHELATVTWGTGSNAVVFGPRSVYVYAGAQPSQDDMPVGFPFALVTLDSATADADSPDLLTQNFSIVTAVEVAGDALGEHAIIGSSRVDLGQSDGAGLGEVTERVRAALQSLTGFDGAAVVVSAVGSSAPQAFEKARQLAYDELTVSAVCTSQPFYAEPQQFRRIGAGGTLTWKGDWCSQRFDFLRYRVGYKTGSTPATTPAGLTSVIFSGTGTEYSTTVQPGRVYQVFADYDPRGTGNAAASSEARIGTYVIT